MDFEWPSHPHVQHMATHHHNIHCDASGWSTACCGAPRCHSFVPSSVSQCATTMRACKQHALFSSSLPLPLSLSFSLSGSFEHFLLRWPRIYTVNWLWHTWFIHSSILSSASSQYIITQQHQQHDKPNNEINNKDSPHQEQTSNTLQYQHKRAIQSAARAANTNELPQWHTQQWVKEQGFNTSDTNKQYVQHNSPATTCHCELQTQTSNTMSGTCNKHKRATNIQNTCNTMHVQQTHTNHTISRTCNKHKRAIQSAARASLAHIERLLWRPYWGLRHVMSPLRAKLPSSTSLHRNACISYIKRLLWRPYWGLRYLIALVRTMLPSSTSLTQKS